MDPAPLQRQKSTSSVASTSTAANLPPPNKREPVRTDVDLPLANTSLSKVVYYIAFGGLLLSAFYMYRVTQWKAEAGGWWNLALGRHPNAPLGTAGSMSTRSGKGGAAGSDYARAGVEAKIAHLADELGIHPTELASAIKGVLPPAKATSISEAAATATNGHGKISGVLAEDTEAANGNIIDRLVGTDEPFGLD
jgi:hypothetical protein